MDRPKIFISSTIYDFRDLRSALKYYLESLGNKVLLSEYNDFTKKLDENSYKSCLDAIDNVDYFILLIGSRVGGLYDSVNKISITQMEYRRAYEMLQKSKVKLITFVREEIWTIKEDRKTLKIFLEKEYEKSHEISKEKIADITNHESNLVSDSEFIFKFIGEVSRDQEMKSAIEGKEGFPIGNWVHTFTNFQEIMDAITVEFGLSQDIKKIVTIENLRYELQNNLSILTQEINGTISKVTELCQRAREHFTGDFNAKSEIPIQYFQSFVEYCTFYIGRCDIITHQFIDVALNSGVFLEYNLDLNKYNQSVISNALLILKENIEEHKERIKLYKQKYRMQIHDFFTNIGHPKTTVVIENLLFAQPFGIYDCQENIINLSVGLVKAFSGDSKYLKDLNINPMYTYSNETEKIEDRDLRLKRLRKWIESR